VVAFSLMLAVGHAEEGETPAAAPPAPERAPGAPNDVGGPRTPPRGSEREAMWPAPSAEDWARPVLIPFERTWDDAVAVSKETGKPILVCINMDGEIASEHYAGIRYRQPEIAALYEPYVCVIASVYRHNLQDYDEAGRRILCPRFGSVTCGEHIGIEPYVFEKFCDGQRIAPRHIAVNLAGNETYDVYYANDTASVFEAIRDRVPDTDVPKTVIVRGDRPVVERVASRAREDREAVEAAYRDGDAAQRRELLEAAKANAAMAPLDLLRLALRGLDPEQAKAARAALARVEAPSATDLMAEALKAPMADAERDALIAALERIGSSSTLAQWLAVVHRGLATTSASVDAEAYAQAMGGATYPAPSIVLVGENLVAHAERKAHEVQARPDDPEARLDLAASLLQQALESPYATARREREAERWARHLYEEARTVAHEAEALGASGWRLDAVQALAAYHLGDTAAAYERSAKAIAEVPVGDTTYMSMAIATVFAEGRYKAIKAAVQAKERFPAMWIADLNAAYSILRAHPLGTDTQLAWHVDLLDWIGADRRVDAALEAGLERFPMSAELHRRLRERTLKYRGAAGLEATYAALLTAAEDPAPLRWFAGLASVVAAEQLRREQAADKARAAYDRAVAFFEATAERWPETADEVDERIALVEAGRARLAWQLGDDEGALAAILASFARRADSAGTRDGLGITPGETAQMLLARLRQREKTDAVAELEAALALIDPELLRPDRP
jgi:hypothetical protein